MSSSRGSSHPRDQTMSSTLQADSLPPELPGNPQTLTKSTAYIYQKTFTKQNCYAQSLSCVRLFATPWAVACQAPLSMGILQARTPEWAAVPFSRGSSRPTDPTQVSLIAGEYFTVWATREAWTKMNIKQQ